MQKNLTGNKVLKKQIWDIDLQTTSDESDAKSSNTENLEEIEYSAKKFKEMGDFQVFLRNDIEILHH